MMGEKQYTFECNDNNCSIFKNDVWLKIEEVVDLLNELAEENEQLKIANARWLDKSLQDKQIRYDNPTCKELTRKYLQLKDENEQLRKEHQEMLEKYLLLRLKIGEVLNDE